MVISRFEVYLVALDPTIGVEIKKTRPCLVVSPDDMNHAIRTVIVAPMTTKGVRIRRGSPVTSRGRMGTSSSTRSARWTNRGSSKSWDGSTAIPPRPCWTCSARCSSLERSLALAEFPTRSNSVQRVPEGFMHVESKSDRERRTGTPRSVESRKPYVTGAVGPVPISPAREVARSAAGRAGAGRGRRRSAFRGRDRPPGPTRKTTRAAPTGEMGTRATRPHDQPGMQAQARTPRGHHESRGVAILDNVSRARPDQVSGSFRRSGHEPSHRLQPAGTPSGRAAGEPHPSSGESSGDRHGATPGHEVMALGARRTAGPHRFTGLGLRVRWAHIQRSADLTWSSAGGTNAAECGRRGS